MKRFTMFASLALALVFAVGAFADVMPEYSKGPAALHGGVTNFAKASRDTAYLIGPTADYVVRGNFTDPVSGAPSLNGWTTADLTESTETFWHVSDYLAEGLDELLGAANLAAWCGDPTIESCVEGDPVGGYGNGWNQILEWTGIVDDNTIGVVVDFACVLNYDVEPDFDYVLFQHLSTDAVIVEDASFTGQALAVPVSYTLNLGTADYQGEGTDEVVLRINVTSDGGWSDADCSWPTVGGACQVDNIVIGLSQGAWSLSSTTDFQSGLGEWYPIYPQACGNFAGVWTNLDDADPCNSNFGSQVAFIDDGAVVPGTGPSICQDWCYGPNGHIVATEGGLAGPESHIWVALESPIIERPAGDYSGAIFSFDAYRHEDLSANAPGIFYTWGIRTTDSGNPADLAGLAFADRNLVYYGGPDYIRVGNNVTDLLTPGWTHAQVQLTCYELGYIWGWDGQNGYPAPYFDNVRLIAFPAFGPAWSTREIDIANDNFPEIAEIDLENLGNNWCRFDMANNISAASHERNDPGDSITVDVVAVRSGAALVSNPEMVWTMQQNPVFDAYRTSALGAASNGVVVGTQVLNAAGIPVADRFSFDLPDTSFLFPGDILHYYFRASDAIDGLEVQETTLPASDPGLAPEGFGDFSRPLAYNSSYVVRALPTINSDGEGGYVQPKTLFWNDFANRGGEAEWHTAFANLGLVLGRDYDVYYTNAPSSGLGNGLGGRASRFTIEGYENMVYTAGDLGVNTISNGDYNNDAGNDIGLLDTWLREGGKDLFITGDEVAYDLTQNAGSTANAFVSNWMKVTYVDNDLLPLINQQATPIVQAMNDAVFQTGQEWVAYGGCAGINTFDCVRTNTAGGGVQLAEFLSPSGAAGAYEWSAATLYEDAANTARIISMPYDFMFIYTAPSAAKVNNPASLPMRARILEQVLGYFGVEGTLEDVTGVPEAGRFAMANYPNPFNPTTKIQYTMPKAGHLTLKIYNVKGELVKTLIDESVEAGTNHIMWDGTNQNGAKVSSGVYFSEARANGQVKVNKMALVK